MFIANRVQFTFLCNTYIGGARRKRKDAVGVHFFFDGEKNMEEFLNTCDAFPGASYRYRVCGVIRAWVHKNRTAIQKTLATALEQTVHRDRLVIANPDAAHPPTITTYNAEYFKGWLESMNVQVIGGPLANLDGEKLSYRCALTRKNSESVYFVAALVPRSHTVKERQMNCLTYFCSATFYTFSIPFVNKGVTKEDKNIDALLITECVGLKIATAMNVALHALPPPGQTPQQVNVWLRDVRHVRRPLLTVEEFRAAMNIARQAYSLMENFYIQCARCNILVTHTDPHMGNICWGVKEDANRMFLIDFNKLDQKNSDDDFLKGVRQDLYDVVKYCEPTSYLPQHEDTRQWIAYHKDDDLPPSTTTLDERLLEVLKRMRFYWERGIRHSFEALVTQNGLSPEDYTDELKKVTVEDSSERLDESIASFGEPSTWRDVHTPFSRGVIVTITVLVVGALLGLVVGIIVMMMMKRRRRVHTRRRHSST